jgi:hypothetical protein
MDHENEIETALRTERPFDALHTFARSLIAEGYDQDRLLQVFEAKRSRLRSANREADEDIIMEVMDCIVGWCGSHMRLFESPVPTTQL